MTKSGISLISSTSTQSPWHIYMYMYVHVHVILKHSNLHVLTSLIPPHSASKHRSQSQYMWCLRYILWCMWAPANNKFTQSHTAMCATCHTHHMHKHANDTPLRYQWLAIMQLIHAHDVASYPRFTALGGVKPGILSHVIDIRWLWSGPSLCICLGSGSHIRMCVITSCQCTCACRLPGRKRPRPMQG